MRVEVEFGGARLDFEVPEDRVVGTWHGPTPMATTDVKARVLEALGSPLDFPPLRQAVVPGDRVVIPIEPDMPEAAPVLSAVVETLQSAGVEAGSIEVLAPAAPRSGWAETLPPGVTWGVHDPAGRERIAYLASSGQGRRVYLNRALTDADCVVPIGLLGYDPVFGYRGPWSLIFPGLSDEETRRSYRSRVSDAPPGRDLVRPPLAEAAHVSWLLGSQFQIGLVPGADGLARVVAGLEEAVRDEGTRAVDEAWSYRADRRADLVIAGIGRPGVPTGIDDLAEGLATAARLVRRGGKIVALSQAEGSIGPALRRLAEADEPRPGPGVLKGLEGEADYPAARRLASTLAWADVYLLSRLGEDAVDDLAMVALARPEEARKLAAASPSCLFISQAESTRAEAAEDD